MRARITFHYLVLIKILSLKEGTQTKMLYVICKVKRFKKFQFEKELHLGDILINAASQVLLQAFAVD